MPMLVRSLGAIGLVAAAMTAAAAQTTDRPGTPVRPIPLPLSGATAPPLPQQAPSASPTPQPSVAPENPLITQQVSQQIAAWRRGRINYSAYEPYAGGTYMPAYVAQIAPLVNGIGPVQSLAYDSASLLLGDLVYRYTANGPDGSLSVLYSIDQSGKIAGISFTPLVFRVAQVPPMPGQPGQPNPIPGQPGAPSPMPAITPIPPVTPAPSPMMSASPSPSPTSSPLH